MFKVFVGEFGEICRRYFVVSRDVIIYLRDNLAF